jgi:hypothetical protein
MTQQRVYNTNAERQAAYRKRLAQRERSGIPTGIGLPATPGHARWNKAIRITDALLAAVCGEMQRYYNDRSEHWQDGERGEAFQERLDAIVDVLDQIQGLP